MKHFIDASERFCRILPMACILYLTVTEAIIIKLRGKSGKLFFYESFVR